MFRRHDELGGAQIDAMDADNLVLDSPRPCACGCGCRTEVLPEDEPLCEDCAAGIHTAP
jgi:hypothetical protein